MAKKFNFNESPAKKVAEEIRDNHEQPIEQGRVAQPIPEVNQQMQQVAQPATPALQQTVAQPAPQVPQQMVQQLVVAAKPDAVPYNEVLKNVGAKIPYSTYERLEHIKRLSERSGIKSEKRNIGDLIVQAIQEFVEKHDVVQ